MTRSTLLSLCLAAPLLACTERSATADAGAPPASAVVTDAGAPAPGSEAVMDAGPGDAGASAVGMYPADAGSGACSASTLTPRAEPARPPLPAPVESMRSRIIAAAVACDYAALATLADEQGKSVRFSFGDATDAAAYWREAEQQGEPVLARMVGVLQRPYARQEGLYYWPAVHVTGAKKDWQALQGLYPAEQLEAMQEGGSGYLGLRLGISPKGDWQLAVAGD
ncbi:hypothetical protein [Pyxidicoccus xibeiensis]|uniref:hypothetical protein n=1 Tax=Pyxidicoccus xibeiensis TaxID=2906759 RepID=UPI0020A8159B|nr:hypothetical protein [Pyxidicoccus xibeiensis]MCP3140625.1 hypothetical protein [Pyxidicoccus xibeiensis]